MGFLCELERQPELIYHFIQVEVTTCTFCFASKQTCSVSVGNSLQEIAYTSNKEATDGII